MNKRNYQRELDQLLEHTQKEEKVPRLFLHSCCAPCSSYVLEYLSQYFEITVFFYNPNISLEEEYRKRVEEIKRLVREMKFAHPVHIEEGSYDPQVFYEMVKGMEKLPGSLSLGGSLFWMMSLHSLVRSTTSLSSMLLFLDITSFKNLA